MIISVPTSVVGNVFSGSLYASTKMPFEEIRGKKNAVQIYEFIKFKDKELNIQEFKWKQ